MRVSPDVEQPPNSATVGIESKPEPPPFQDLASPSPPDGFNPGWRFYASFISLCIITVAVALDATSLSVALPVMLPPPLPSTKSLLNPFMITHRRGISTAYGFVWRMYTSSKLTPESRSSLNPSTAAPSPPSGAGHLSSCPPPSSSPPSLRCPTYSAANLSSSSLSSCSPWVRWWVRSPKPSPPS